LAPSKPYQPENLYDSFNGGSITIGWHRPDSDGGWEITDYLIWIDDGAGNWPLTPITQLANSFDSQEYLIYEALGLTDTKTYGFKIQALNAIGVSVESNTQYFVCANVPAKSEFAPVLEAATETSISISWSVPASDGGTPITGYKVYMNPIDDGDWYLIYDGSGQPTVLTLTESNLVRGAYYRFKSQAINLVGEGFNSTESTLLCAETPYAPG
jgi:titin